MFRALLLRLGIEEARTLRNNIRAAGRYVRANPTRFRDHLLRFAPLTLSECLRLPQRSSSLVRRCAIFLVQLAIVSAARPLLSSRRSVLFGVAWIPQVLAVDRVIPHGFLPDTQEGRGGGPPASRRGAPRYLVTFTLSFLLKFSLYLEFMFIVYRAHTAYESC